MKNKPTFYQLLAIAKQMLKEGQEISTIKNYLKSQGMNDSSTNEIIQLLNHANKSTKSKTGIAFLLIGLCLLGSGFFGSILFTESALILNISLYGLTGFGIVLLIIGLAIIFH